MIKKCVLVGVTGGIAAYKALDVISKLRKAEVEVRVIMTKSATEFVTQLSFQSMSQNMVITDMFLEPKAWEIQHISLAQRADLVLIVPATANIIGKVANGIADDMLSTTIMATKAQVVFAPAMNTNMYENRIVQDNIKKLTQYGYKFIEPASGRLACGDIGKGKLADTDDIVEDVLSRLYENKDLQGQNIIVTAGPTKAEIDPVRFITNKSTGKMGYEIAKEARDRGANVTLISGTDAIKRPCNVEFVKINTNEEMYNEVIKRFDDANIVIKAAAVADYKPKEYSEKKIKKQEGDWSLALERDRDILKTLGSKKNKQILVGFAAESNDLIENAVKKLKNKNLDYIVANDISSTVTGFGSDENKVTIISENEKIDLSQMSKRDVAKNIFDIINRR